MMESGRWLRFFNFLCLGFVPAAYVKKLDSTLTASQQQLVEASSISAKQNQIEDQYQRLLLLGETRRKKLEEACKGYQLLREANDLSDWIRNKVKDRFRPR